MIETLLPSAAGDDGRVVRTGSAYPPVTTGPDASTAVVEVGKLQSAGTYAVHVGLVRYRTQDIDSAKSIISASLRIWPTLVQDNGTDNRALNIEYYDGDANWPIDAADYTATASSTAGSLDLSSFTANAFNEIALTSPVANIDRSGYTGFRLHISGGAPTGLNRISTDEAIQRVALLIHTNLPPTAPTRGARDGFDATEAATFTWTFSDPDTEDAQGAFQLEIRRTSDNVVVYDSGKSSSSQESVILLANTLVNDEEYRWRVKTWDEHDVEGTFSSFGVFFCSGKPVANITDPTAAEIITGPTTTVTWTYSDPEATPQRAHKVVLENLTTSQVVLDTGKVVAGSVLTYDLTGLLDATDYRVGVTVWDGDDIASVEDTVDFEVAYTPPPTPTVTLTPNNDLGHIEVAVSTPAPVPPEPEVASVDIYRRISGETTWVRIVTGMADDSSYLDHAVASGVTYEYKATAIGEDGSSQDSAVEDSFVTLQGIHLHDPVDANGTHYSWRRAIEPRSREDTTTGELLRFAGRRYPVAEFGESDQQQVTFTLSHRVNAGFDGHSDDLDALEALIARKSTLCYRDGRGRKMFGVTLGHQVNDWELGFVSSVSLVTTEHSEEV